MITVKIDAKHSTENFLRIAVKDRELFCMEALAIINILFNGLSDVDSDLGDVFKAAVLHAADHQDVFFKREKGHVVEEQSDRPKRRYRRRRPGEPPVQ